MQLTFYKPPDSHHKDEPSAMADLACVHTCATKGFNVLMSVPPWYSIKEFLKILGRSHALSKRKLLIYSIPVYSLVNNFWTKELNA